MQPSNLFILGTFEHNNGKIMLVYTVYEDDNISSHKLFELYSYWVQYYPVIVILPNSNFPPIQYGHSYYYLYVVFLMLTDVQLKYSAKNLTSYLFIYCRFLTWNYGVFKKLGVKGPRPIPIFGTMLSLIRKVDIVFICFLHVFV